MRKLLTTCAGIVTLGVAAMALSPGGEKTTQSPRGEPMAGPTTPRLVPVTAPVVVLTEALDFNSDGVVDDRDLEQWNHSTPEVEVFIGKLYRALLGYDEDASVPSVDDMDDELNLRGELDLGWRLIKEAIRHPEANAVAILSWDLVKVSAMSCQTLSDDEIEQAHLDPMPCNCRYRWDGETCIWFEDETCISPRYVY